MLSLGHILLHDLVPSGRVHEKEIFVFHQSILQRPELLRLALGGEHRSGFAVRIPVGLDDEDLLPLDSLHEVRKIELEICRARGRFRIPAVSQCQRFQVLLERLGQDVVCLVRVERRRDRA